MSVVTRRPEPGNNISTAEQARKYRCAVVKWDDRDGISLGLGTELCNFGYEVRYFRFDAPIPSPVDVVLTFAPYGRLLQIPHQYAGIPAPQRPLFVHWNFEGLPHPALPWPLVSALGSSRSWVDRLNDAEFPWQRSLAQKPPLSWVNRKLHKFRYVGDYQYANRHGLIDLLVESSQINIQFFRRHGIPAVFVPWGTSPAWYADLKLARDIDVLWMGARRTRRRSHMLDQVRAGLAARGVRMFVADNEEHPFIYEAKRTEILNRSKITLSLLPTWWDNAFPFRYHMAAGNGSLVVSEPVLPHNPAYRAGEHYVAAPPGKLVDTIMFYLEHEPDRCRIVENARSLVTTQMTLRHSVAAVVDAIQSLKPATV